MEYKTKQQVNMEKKTLYWIRGNKYNPEGVKKALKAKGIRAWPGTVCNLPDYIYYGVEGQYAESTENISTKCILRRCGIELQPIPKETFKPFDKVIVRKGTCTQQRWKVGLFSHEGLRPCKTGSIEHYYVCVGSIYQECHHYEDWMAKYLGTETPFEDFRKEDE